MDKQKYQHKNVSKTNTQDTNKPLKKQAEKESKLNSKIAKTTPVKLANEPSVLSRNGAQATFVKQTEKVGKPSGDAKTPKKQAEKVSKQNIKNYKTSNKKVAVKKKKKDRNLKKTITTVLITVLIIAASLLGLYVWQTNITYNVTFASAPGIIFSGYESKEIKNGKTFSFRIDIIDDDVQVYESLFFVKANNKIITPIEEVYYVDNIKNNVTISIGGVGSKNLEIENQKLLGSTDQPTSLIIPNGITEIAFFAFQNKTSIISVHIPNSVTKLGGSAFSGCTNLENITLSDNINDFGSYVFNATKWYNNQLDGLVYINNWVYGFKNASNLTTLIIKDGIVGIAPLAFTTLINLQEVELSSNLMYIEDDVFIGTNLKNITLPKNLKKIGSHAFESTKIENFNFPSSIEEIGDYAFVSCSQLKEIEFNSNVLLGQAVFANCATLEKVTFHKGLQKVNYYLFVSSIKLTTLIINSINVPVLIDSSAFQNVHAQFSIYVPDGSVNTYRSAQGWSHFSDKIKGISELTLNY